MTPASTATSAAPRAASGTGRVIRAWRALPHERRLAAYASLGLFVTLFLPWYQRQFFTVVSGKPRSRRRHADGLGRVLVRRGRGAAGRRRRADAAVPARRGPGLPSPRRRRRCDHRRRLLDLRADRVADLRQAGRQPAGANGSARASSGASSSRSPWPSCSPTPARGSAPHTDPSHHYRARRAAAGALEAGQPPWGRPAARRRRLEAGAAAARRALVRQPRPVPAEDPPTVPREPDDVATLPREPEDAATQRMPRHSSEPARVKRPALGDDDQLTIPFDDGS